MNPQISPPPPPQVTLFLKPNFLISALPGTGIQVQVQANPPRPIRS